MSKVLVPLATGFEEVEAITIIDLLRRAGVDVTTASLADTAVEGAHGVTVTADKDLDAALADSYDMVVLPGGLPGATNLEADERLMNRIKQMAGEGKYTCAICAAPVALAKAGVLEGKSATSYPGFLDQLGEGGFNFTGGVVETDGKVITSRGPGTAMDFAIELIAALEGTDKAHEVETALVRP